MKADLLLEIKAALGEGAFWNNKSQKLYWIDIEGKTFNVFDPYSGINNAYNTHKRVGTVVSKTSNSVLLALEDGLATLNLDNGQIIYDLKTDIHSKGNRFNDGKCDPQGRFWVGTLTIGQATNDNKLYCYDKGLFVEKVSGLSISNGIVWTNDNLTMYHIDTPTSEIVKYDFDPLNGNISNRQIVIKIPAVDGYPDGMAIDAEGMLWVALWDGFGVARYNPKNGKLLQKIDVPVPKVTSCAFGGANLQTLYITTASAEMSDAEVMQYPLSGSLFSIETNIQGLSANEFKVYDSF